MPKVITMSWRRGPKKISHLKIIKMKLKLLAMEANYLILRTERNRILKFQTLNDEQISVPISLI